MTIRGGGRPRTTSQARPLDPDPPSWTPGDGRGAPRRTSYPGRRRGHHPLQFLLFALALAALVLFAMVTVLRPLVASAVVGWADDNPSAYRMPFVRDLVRENLGGALTETAGTSADPVEFTVNPRDTPQTLAPRLESAALIRNQRAFLFEATEADLGEHLQAGTFAIPANLTAGGVVAALTNPELKVTTIQVNFREGLRLEQIVAKLETISSKVDPQAFYDLVTKPPSDLVADYPFLNGRSWPTLEGFLAPATYTLRIDDQNATDAEGLLRMMLDAWQQQVGAERIAAAAKHGGLGKVLTLASIVEHEAVVDSERPVIAGVYQNRLARLHGVPAILNADPTILYALDTVALRGQPLPTWQSYFFWKAVGNLADVQLPADLAGFQTYQRAGLPPWPICTPSVPSIDAALAPDTKSGYLYFVAIPDGGGKHAFARTYAEHQANLKKYGYTG
jgi:UPF0755 protein